MENIESEESQLNSLKQRLEAGGIDISKWGQGQAKNVDSLYRELKRGDSVLLDDVNGKLLRKLVVGDVDVYYISPEGKKFRLKEDRQVLSDGRERVRPYMKQAVSGKIKVGEDPKEGTTREFEEELGINGVPLSEIGTEEELISSPSFPGLQSHYTHHKFMAILNDEQFRPEGYVEKIGNFESYFVWEEVD